MRDAIAVQGTARLRRWIVVVGVVALAAITASSIYDTARAYRQATADTDRELVNIGKALAEQIEVSVRSIDVLLQATADWYATLPPGTPPTAIEQGLASRAIDLPQVALLSISDARGIRRYRSRDSAAADFSVADRSYFLAHRDDPGVRLFVSEPIVTRSDGRPGFVLSRRLRDVGGQFAGVVSAIVELDEYQQFYHAINLGTRSSIGLYRADGTLVLREPPARAAIGKSFPRIVDLARTVPDGTPQEIVSPIDGVPRFTVVTRVDATPLLVSVGREAASVLEAWRDEAYHVAGRTIVILVLGALAIVALVRQLRLIEEGERALRDSEGRLRQSQKLEAIGTLAGGIAHDFNNILGAILGYGELAQNRSPEGGTVRRYIDNIMHAAGRARSLVERVLAFSRSGVGERVAVNVQSVIGETVDLVAASMSPGIVLECRLNAGNAAVLGDATQLHQVAMNLCTNAVQAMGGKGLLEVTLSLEELTARHAMSHGALPPGSYVRLCIRDTGPGILPEVYERMFDPFFTTKGVGEGTGLGLSLVHGIVTDLGGAIDVTTSPGHGTTFAIWLPVSGEAIAPAPDTTVDLPQGGGKTVMIVDDELPLVALTEEMLAKLGYEPVGFSSSTEALRAFREDPNRYDAVLTDETMPEMTGTELALEIRKIRPGLPLLLMSGYRGPQLVARAHAAGAVEVLRKPLQSRDLAEGLARALSEDARTESAGS